MSIATISAALKKILNGDGGSPSPFAGIAKSLLLGTKINEIIDAVNALGTAVTSATITATTAVVTNTISERTAASGVTIDGTLVKDGGVSTADAGSITTNTIAEKTANSGVTIDGCLVKDGRAANLATAAVFQSTEQTGNGAEQDIAHGFGSVPTLAFAYFTELDGNAADIAYGAHDGTNVKVTVTTGQKYHVFALR